MRPEDIEMTRAVRHELSRRHLDVSETHISANHGVIHLYGRIRPLPNHHDEYAEELHTLVRVLKQRPGIRDVMVEAELDNIKVPIEKTRSRRDHERT